MLGLAAVPCLAALYIASAAVPDTEVKGWMNMQDDHGMMPNLLVAASSCPHGFPFPLILMLTIHHPQFGLAAKKSAAARCFASAGQEQL